MHPTQPRINLIMSRRNKSNNDESKEGVPIIPPASVPSQSLEELLMVKSSGKPPKSPSGSAKDKGEHEDIDDEIATMDNNPQRTSRGRLSVKDIFDSAPNSRANSREPPSQLQSKNNEESRNTKRGGLVEMELRTADEVKKPILYTDMDGVDDDDDQEFGDGVEEDEDEDEEEEDDDAQMSSFISRGRYENYYSGQPSEPSEPSISDSSDDDVPKKQKKSFSRGTNSKKASLNHIQIDMSKEIDRMIKELADNDEDYFKTIRRTIVQTITSAKFEVGANKDDASIGLFLKQEVDRLVNTADGFSPGLFTKILNLPYLYKSALIEVQGKHREVSKNLENRRIRRL